MSLPAPEARIVPPRLLNWPPFSTSPADAVASSRPWFTNPPPLGVATAPWTVGEITRDAAVPVASTVPPAWLKNSTLLLVRNWPEPWIVLLRLVTTSIPLLRTPKTWLLLLSLSVTVPPPVSVGPSAVRKSVVLPAELSWN